MLQQSISYQAGYNMRVLTIIQNKSQLEDRYGKAGALTLMANHALMIMYAPSPVVQSDANEYSEMLGYQTVKNKNKSRSFAGNFGGSGSRSESVSDQRRALMLPQELKELGQWREIVSLENCKPILCDKIKYFEDPAFTARINWETPAIPIQDVDTFVAKLEDRRRDLTAADAKLPAEELAAKTVGLDEAPDLPANVNELSEAELDDVLEQTAQGFCDAVVKEPLDRDKFRMEKEAAAAAAQSIFGSSEDESADGTDGFDLVDETQPASGPRSEAEPVSREEAEQQETADLLAMFAGDTTTEDEPQESDAGADADISGEKTAAQEVTLNLSPDQSEENNDEPDGISAPTLAPEQENAASGDTASDSAQAAGEAAGTAGRSAHTKDQERNQDLAANEEDPEAAAQAQLLAKLGFDDEAPDDAPENLSAEAQETLNTLGFSSETEDEARQA